MSSPARVTSIDAVHAFRGSLREFEQQIRDVLLNTGLELRRAMDWIEYDRPAHWKSQYEKASQAMLEARSNLDRCELTSASDDRRSCTVEKKILEKAKRRVDTTERKIRAVRHWQRILRHELADVESQLAKLGHMLDDDVAGSIASLGRMVAALDKYAQRSSPTASGATSSATDESVLPAEVAAPHDASSGQENA